MEKLEGLKIKEWGNPKVCTIYREEKMLGLVLVSGRGNFVLVPYDRQWDNLSVMVTEELSGDSHNLEGAVKLVERVVDKDPALNVYLEGLLKF